MQKLPICRNLLISNLCRLMSEIYLQIFLFSLSTIVTKVASDATHVIKDKVGSSVATTMINEFNREQEEFIKSKGS